MTPKRKANRWQRRVGGYLTAFLWTICFLVSHGSVCTTARRRPLPATAYRLLSHSAARHLPTASRLRRDLASPPVEPNFERLASNAKSC